MSSKMEYAIQDMQNAMGGNDNDSKREIVWALQTIVGEAALRGCDSDAIIAMVRQTFAAMGPGTEPYAEAQEVYREADEQED
jgi:hypothetical protein